MSLDNAPIEANDSAPLAMDEAVSLLTAADDDLDDAPADQGAEGSTEHEDAADDQAADDVEASDDDPTGDDAEDDEGADGESAEPTVPAPEFWSAEDKAIFAKAPPEVQQVIVARMGEADRQVKLAKEEAAAARKEASTVADTRAAVDGFLERAQSLFRDKWDGVDWAQWAQDDPTAAFQAKLEYEAELDALNKANAAREATEAQEHQQFIRDEMAKLKEAGHPLADPDVTKAKAARQELATYLTGQGVPPEALKWASAEELKLAHKAMLYDRLQADLARKSPPKNPSAAGPAAPKPSAPPPPRKVVNERKRTEVVGRAMKTGKVDDAVAALLALGA